MTLQTIPTDFDDFESDDLNEVGTQIHRTVEAAMVAEFRPTFDEPCKKCGGRGMYQAYTGRTLGACFACKGRGFITRLTSPESRAKAKASAAARKAKNADRNLADFAEAHPEAWAFIESSPTFEFAVAMREAVAKYGDLTERQLAAVERCVESRKAKAAQWAAEKAEAAKRAESAPAVTDERLRRAFEAARAAGIKYPKMNLGLFRFKPAPETGKNPGAIYVTGQADVYLGKVIGGRFQASRECSAPTADEITLAVNDPKAAALAYGLRTGICCICSRTLTNGESIERGIGPICAEKFGW